MVKNVGEKKAAAGRSPYLKTGDEFRASLRDGRRVVYGGDEIADVTTHPLFRRSVDLWAELFDAQHDPATQDITTYFDPQLGARASTGWLVPTSKEDLAQRRRLLEFSTDKTFGVYGRPPDYGPTLAMGFLAAMHLIEGAEPDASAKIKKFIEFGRENNLLSTDLIADAQADRSLPHAENPGRLRCVKETAEGITVYGTKPVASSASMGNWGGVATLISPNMDPDAVLWAYVPMNAKGITFVAREQVTSAADSAEDHPINHLGEEVDALIIFDHVFIPWEHVFSFRNKATLAYYLDVGLLAHWAILARMARRAQYFAATAKLIVDVLGTEKIPQVRAQVAEVYSYASALEAFILAGEEKGAQSPHGVYVPDRALITSGRLYAITQLPVVMQIVRELCGQGLVSRFTAKDLERADIGKWVDEFLPGHHITGRGKNRLMNFVWDLTCSSHSARVALFENVNSTPPPTVRQQVYQSYDVAAATRLIREATGLDQYTTD
ncbi:4-hydroxyphenylacetate 3-hydroxylase N-terminal domain-containing protein [Hyphomicrobium sp.]|uniref:4-hydroxyphenylacetate 3-hydroxylase N-terminal domain-containing protein n=1 Tax=Hyphomicrobium sp. TaxID=82 RepID=UPI001D3CC1EA|nr:4-hydroxyphenylacetate 3-hydroxylase N-terminal domain-containing protein [Hyphomicrobium sp.]MBY0558775.1 4-hydroxyphenylacetate 3-monooxygenase [Hyphomicrobium sp.]